MSNPSHLSLWFWVPAAIAFGGGCLFVLALIVKSWWDAITGKG